MHASHEPPLQPPLRNAGVETAAMLFALTFPAIGTWLYFVALAGQPAMQPAYAATKVIQFAFPIVWVVWWQRSALRPRWAEESGIAAGLTVGACIMAATLTMYYGYLRHHPLLATAPDTIRTKLADFGIDSMLKFVALATFYSLIHSLLEEFYWRWFVFGQLSRYLPWQGAILLSSLGFMAHHVLVLGQFFKGFGPATWFFSLAVAIGGAIWAWIYRRTGSLYAPWMSHMLVDAGLMWVGYDLWHGAF